MRIAPAACQAARAGTDSQGTRASRGSRRSSPQAGGAGAAGWALRSAAAARMRLSGSVRFEVQGWRDEGEAYSLAERLSPECSRTCHGARGYRDTHEATVRNLQWPGRETE